MMKQTLNFVKIIGLAAIVLVLMPTEVWAAEGNAGNIFTIISQKMISTVRDLRSIVYVIAGFGLIMFSFLAIFNKISWKHLSYIMISLSLLAVMMPFINYFSGANLPDDVNYGNFINGGDPSIVGSDAGEDKPCTPESCPKIEGIGAEGIGGVAGGNGDIFGGVGTPKFDSSDLKLPSVAAATGWDANGCRTNTDGKQECCQGKIKNGVCKKTTLQKIKGIVETGQNAIKAARSAEETITNVHNAAKNAAHMADQVGDIIKGDGSIVEKIGDLASAVNQGTHNIGTNINRAVGNTGDTMDFASDVAKGVSTNYETNPDGKNSWSDALEHGGVRDALDTVHDRVSGAEDDVGNYSGTIARGSQTAQQAKDTANRFKRWFGRRK